MELEILFQKIEGEKILVVGDAMLDRYLFGYVERISPEAPVPIVEVYQEEDRLGGAANVAWNLKTLGMEPILCAVIGQDHEGDRFLRLMTQEGLRTDGMLRVSSRPTTSKTRVIGAHQQMLRIDKEEKTDLDETSLHELQDRIANFINQYAIRAIILQDYNKGVLSKECIHFILQLSSEKNIPLFVDPKYKNFFEYVGVYLFKPNIRELGRALDMNLRPESPLPLIQEAIQKLRKRMPHQNTLVTLSDRGMVIMNHNETFTHIPAHYRDVADVSGAGDTVIATLVAMTTAGAALHDAAHVANLAGGIVCEYMGVVPIRKEQLLQEAHKLPNRNVLP
jgi:rfaE bifunctional protein kinase chain/domain